METFNWVRSQPISVMVTGIDSMEALSQNVAIARGSRPLDAEQQQALLARVASAAADGHLGHYKTRW